MIGITSLLSLISGIITGVAPDILGEWKASRESEREMKMLEHQVALTERQVQLENKGKLAVADRELSAAEAAAWAEANKNSLTAYDKSLDRLSTSGWLFAEKFNALVRPFYGLVAGSLIAYIAYIAVATSSSVQLPAIVSLFCEGSIGYFLGHRSFEKMRASNASQ